jgi:hypothetical protein
VCPHVKLGGGLCGRDAKHCLCLCMICQAPMFARQVCLTRQADGSLCTWGDGLSPEPLMTSPLLGRIYCGDQSIGVRNLCLSRTPLPDYRIGGGLCLPNLEPGGPDGLPLTPRKERTPKKSKPYKIQMFDPLWYELSPSPTRGSPAKLPPPTPYPRPAIPRAWLP